MGNGHSRDISPQSRNNPNFKLNHKYAYDCTQIQNEAHREARHATCLAPGGLPIDAKAQLIRKLRPEVNTKPLSCHCEEDPIIQVHSRIFCQRAT